MAFTGFSGSGISFGDTNTNMILVNLCTIYADISRTVKNVSEDLSLYTDMYKAATDPAQKIELEISLLKWLVFKEG